MSKHPVLAHMAAGLVYCAGLWAVGAAQQASTIIPPQAYRGTALLRVHFMALGEVRNRCEQPFSERDGLIAQGCQQDGTPDVMLPYPCGAHFHHTAYANALCAAQQEAGLPADRPSVAWVNFQRPELVRRVCAGRVACWSRSDGLIWAENPSAPRWIGDPCADLVDHEKGHFLGAKPDHSDWVWR